MGVMRCPRCGKDIDEQSYNCPECGCRLRADDGRLIIQESFLLKRKGYPLGITGFVVSILAAIEYFMDANIGAIMSIVAFIFSLVGLIKKEKQCGWAIAGIVISVLNVILWILSYVLRVVYIGIW